MQGTSVQLYAILKNGQLKQYPEVEVAFEEQLPSGGAFSVPGDTELVKDIEDEMIEAYGHAIIKRRCRAKDRSGAVDLKSKLLRPQHVESLMKAVKQHGVTWLNLEANQLGPEGGRMLAEALQTDTTLQALRRAPAHRQAFGTPC